MMYRTLVADPPWATKAGPEMGPYQVGADGRQVFSVANTRTRDLAYPTLSVERIATLPVAQHVAENAHCYLWTINRYLPDAFRILTAWGFTYSTTLVWAKAPMGGGLGGAYGLATEYILFGRRGTLTATGRVGRNWFNWKRPYDERGKPKHSAKPPEFYSMVERISPGPYLELFARAPRSGWHVWGDEVIPDVEIAA